MISILFLPCFLLVFGLICTFSKIPAPTKKLLSSLFSSQDLITTNNIKCLKSIPSQDDHNNSSTMKSAYQEKDQSSSTTSSNKNIIMTAELTSVFATFDKNNDGYITRQELRESLKNIGISAEERDVSEMIRRVDLNEDGLMDFDEFCELFKSIINNNKNMQEDQDEGNNINNSNSATTRDQDLKEAFDVFDQNSDGLITVEELGLVLSYLGFSEGNKLDDCREMIRRVDIDGDGMVNFDEFKMMMRSGFGRIISVS